MEMILSKEQIKRLQSLDRKMAESLKESRYRHTVAVAHTAAALSMVHGASLYDALTAGMLHDAAKCYSNEELLLKCRKKGIPIREIEECNPSLLHAKYGAYLAKERFGVTNEEVISAIACHTTGKPGMTLLEKIIFIADYIEPYRNHTETLPEIRKLCFLDLDQAMVRILSGMLDYLKETEAPIDEMTEKTFLYYQKRK